MALGLMAGLGLGANALGGILNIGMNHIQRKTDRDFNAKQAQLNRDFQANQADIAYERQKELRQTYYQDTVSSMEEAGINPAVALGNSGSIGAGTPSVSSASGNSASVSGSNNSTYFGDILNGLANVAKVYNNDSDRTNNLSLTQAVGMLANVAKIFK